MQQTILKQMEELDQRERALVQKKSREYQNFKKLELKLEAGEDRLNDKKNLVDYLEHHRQIFHDRVNADNKLERDNTQKRLER